MPRTRKSSGTKARTPTRPPLTSTLLALDLSLECTGWAFFVGSSLIDHGHISFAKMEHGAAACGLYAELSRISKIYGGVGIDAIGFEHAFRQPGVSNEAYMTLQTALKMWAHRHGIPHYKVGTSALKKAVTGYGRAEKPDVIQAVIDKYKVDLDPQREHPDSDIADAIGVGITLRS